MKNSFLGMLAGYGNSTGGANSYFGFLAGNGNATGNLNSIFGYRAGYQNSASGNSFLGGYAGYYNISGAGNSFFGQNAGMNNYAGDNNSFFGDGAGYFSAGSGNSFFGQLAGEQNAGGNQNTFMGYNADSVNGGNYNTLLGANSLVAGLISNSTALGFRAEVTQSDSLVLGSINGINGATADTKVGIGTTAPSGKLHIKDGSSELFYVGGDANIGIGTVSPDKRVQIIGTAAINATLHIGGTGDETRDIFAGMGSNVDTGPAFNYGYAGYSFGRSAGFFNVRPDPSAVAPNPSLRFMTANQQRMIITNTGNVGIGTTSPKTGLQTDNGAIYIGSPGEGIILRSPDGLVCVKLTVSNTAALASTPMACP